MATSESPPAAVSGQRTSSSHVDEHNGVPETDPDVQQEQGNANTNGTNAAPQGQSSEVPHSLDNGLGSGTPGKAQADTKEESETTSVRNYVSVKSEQG